MNRADRRRWTAARTLPDLGELTAQWLEGHIASQPGYEPNCGPDPETQPLIPVLARLNRAGYVTTGSQPGLAPTPGYDGRLWQQRAAVDGIADDTTLHQLAEAVTGTDLLLIHHRTHIPPWWRRWLPHWLFGPTGGEDAVVVTASTDGHEHTWFGGRITHDYLQIMFDEVSDQAFEVILSSWQVTLIDPHWGRENLLWDVLTDRFLHHPASTHTQPHAVRPGADTTRE